MFKFNPMNYMPGMSHDATKQTAKERAATTVILQKELAASDAQHAKRHVELKDGQGKILSGQDDILSEVKKSAISGVEIKQLTDKLHDQQVANAELSAENVTLADNVGKFKRALDAFTNTTSTPGARWHDKGETASCRQSRNRNVPRLYTGAPVPFVLAAKGRDVEAVAVAVAATDAESKAEEVAVVPVVPLAGCSCGSGDPYSICCRTKATAPTAPTGEVRPSFFLEMSNHPIFLKVASACADETSEDDEFVDE